MENTSKLNLTEDLLIKILMESTDFKLRNGIVELFENIYKHKIKCYINSGGLKCVIETALMLTIPNYNKIKEEKLIEIVGNEIIFDESGKSVDFLKPVVYQFNKSKVSIV